ncbi:related to Pre-mRNA-splicing factor BUD31 [Nakaseomyces glabratus]|nr:related to Pre-mRNA-splicing factor BUD31 [Nakaseomyces glabratus]SLM12214.1 related to Pre-mRNA-splicing factor BUD31 [Nakaseomyces glabratus]
MKVKGYERVEPVLAEFERRLKEIGKEDLWRIVQIHSERSRYVYTMYYKRRAISRELYEWLLKKKVADRRLIAKWRKRGYEKLCCLQCVQQSETNHGSTCICRVPRLQLEAEAEKKGVPVSFKECVNCGCHAAPAQTDDMHRIIQDKELLY